MKKRTIKFHLELEVEYPDHLDDDWVSEQFLMSPRFSTEVFKGDPGVVMSALSGVL